LFALLSKLVELTSYSRCKCKC